MPLSHKLTIALICTSMTGCYYTTKPYEPTNHRDRIELPVARSVGPEPVYSRLRWVQTPDVLPAREIPGKNLAEFDHVPNLRPVYQMIIKDGTLQEISRVLAATARYESYCAPSLSSNRVTIESLGTIDELGEVVAKRAGIKVVIDHANREVRFLAPGDEDTTPQNG